MEQKFLNSLLQELEQELLRLGYTDGTMKFYRRRWNSLLEFADEKGESYYSEQLGIDFVLEQFGITQDDFSKVLSQSETQELRVIRMIGDYQLHGTILRRYLPNKELLTVDDFLKLKKEFHEHCISKEYSNSTVYNYVRQSTQFMGYLESQKVPSISMVTMDLVNSYIKTLAGYSYKTVEQQICSLRAFFRYLYQKETIAKDFASNLPMVQARKQTSIPSVWTQDELKKLIAAIDRGSPKGKRDYAIILIACRLGLRCLDIKNLCFENLSWEKKELSFIQSKTKHPVVLPLVSDVGWAIIDYIKYGRPKVDCSNIFVRHTAPFLPFSEGDHLNQLISDYMKKAHIPKLKKRRGMHSLRHTMASMLLEKDTPLPVISDIIGHIDTNSTAVYLKVDMKRLRECPLDFEEVICVE